MSCRLACHIASWIMDTWPSSGPGSVMAENRWTPASTKVTYGCGEFRLLHTSKLRHHISKRLPRNVLLIDVPDHHLDSMRFASRQNISPQARQQASTTYLEDSCWKTSTREQTRRRLIPGSKIIQYQWLSTNHCTNHCKLWYFPFLLAIPYVQP